jgi:hypothetical protein
MQDGSRNATALSAVLRYLNLAENTLRLLRARVMAKPAASNARAAVSMGFQAFSLARRQSAGHRSHFIPLAMLLETSLIYRNP